MIFEYLPLIVFGTVYAMKGMLIATAALVIVSITVVPILWKKTGKPPYTHIATAVLVGLFGGITIISGDTDFIKMKPTIASLIFALVLLGGVFMGKYPIKMMMQSVMDMTDTAWKTLSIRTAIYFTVMALLNEYVWRMYSESIWVQFKIFGLTGGYFVFMILHIPFFKKNAVLKK